MLKNLIVIEGKDTIQYDTLEELVKDLIDENFFEESKEQKLEKMKIKAIANTLGNKKQILENVNNIQEYNLDKTFIILDEITYILSLLLTNNIVLLERKDSNILTKSLDKSNIEKNYIVVNKFAEYLLREYLKKYWQIAENVVKYNSITN